MDVYFPKDVARILRALYSTNHQTADTVAANPAGKDAYLRAFDNALGGMALAFGLVDDESQRSLALLCRSAKED